MCLSCEELNSLESDGYTVITLKKGVSQQSLKKIPGFTKQAQYQSLQEKLNHNQYRSSDFYKYKMKFRKTCQTKKLVLVFQDYVIINTLLKGNKNHKIENSEIRRELSTQTILFLGMKFHYFYVKKFTLSPIDHKNLELGGTR